MKMTKADLAEISKIADKSCYPDEVTVYGMLGANASFIPGSGNLAVYKSSKKTQAISWISDFDVACNDILYSYMASPPQPKTGCQGAFRETQIVAGVFDQCYFDNPVKKMRKCMRSISKIASIADECPLDEILDSIKRWERGHGASRYRMQMHSSYDKRFFKRSLSESAWLRERTKIWYFVDKRSRCIGYRVFTKEPTVHTLSSGQEVLEFKSLLRKYDPAISHLCQFIDFMTYKSLWNEWRKPFIVNLGCSSGGVKRYKLENFPVASASPRWFYRKKGSNSNGMS